MSRLSGNPIIVQDAATKLAGDATASAALATSVVTTANIQTVSAALAASAAALIDLADGLVADATAKAALILGVSRPLTTENGSGAAAAANYASRVTLETTGLRKTEILIDIAGLASVATDNDVIGDPTPAANAHIGQIIAAESGTIIFGRITCLEVPATGELDIDLYANSDGTVAGSADGTGDTVLVERAANWAAGDIIQLTGVPAADDYLYLTVGTASTPTAATYTTGIFLIEFWGV